MFCAGCGTQILEGLNFCSRCGRRVAESNISRTSLAGNLTMAAGYVGGAGFLGFLFIVLIFSKSGMPSNQLIPIAFFYFASLFGICYLILRQASIFAGKKDVVESYPRGETSADPTYLRPTTTAQLEEPRDPGIGSVTEHTTRTLDKVPARKL
jgi:uncharacterized membrane protein YvbJ